MKKLTNLSHVISKMKKHLELIVGNIQIIISLAKIEIQLDKCIGYAVTGKNNKRLSKLGEENLPLRKQLEKMYKHGLETLRMEFKEAENENKAIKNN